MKSKEIAKNIIHYYNQNRQVGHTTQTLNSVTDSLVVCSNHASACGLSKKFHGNNTNTFLSVYELDYALIGHRKPIVFDNHALCIILQNLVNDMEALEKVNNYLDTKLKGIQEILNT